MPVRTSTRSVFSKYDHDDHLAKTSTSRDIGDLLGSVIPIIPKNKDVVVDIICKQDENGPLRIAQVHMQGTRTVGIMPFVFGWMVTDDQVFTFEADAGSSFKTILEEAISFEKNLRNPKTSISRNIYALVRRSSRSHIGT